MQNTVQADADIVTPKNVEHQILFKRDKATANLAGIGLN
jgi:hypothetical protein